MNKQDPRITLIKDFIKRTDAQRREEAELKKLKKIVIPAIQQLGQKDDESQKWKLELDKLEITAIEKLTTFFNQKKAKEDFPVLNTDEYMATGEPYFTVQFKQKLED